MNLFQAILGAIPGEISSDRVQYTVLDGRGGYFQNVRRLLEFTPERVVLAGKKGSLSVEGKELSLGKCFRGDVVVRGDISKVERGE